MSLRLKAFLLFVFMLSFCRNEDGSSDDEEIKSRKSLQSMQDVEILSYFLFIKYLYFTKKHQWNNRTLNINSISKLINYLSLKRIRHDEENELNCNNSLDVYEEDFGMTDDNKRIGKIHSLCKLAAECQSPDNMISLVGNGEKIHNSIARICPLLLFQMFDESCGVMYSDQINNNREEDDLLRPSALSVWIYSTLCVTIISCCSLCGVAILPFLTDRSYHNVLNLFEGLAVGSLVGSAIFHLIPQAFDLLDIQRKHDHLWKALVVFFGIYVFFWSERFMKIIANLKKKGKVKEDRKNNVNKGDKANGDVPSIELTSKSHPVNENNVLLNKGDTHGYHSHSEHFHEHILPTSNTSHIATVAWMIIFGDGLHNFIDGLSIGAAFSRSILSGVSISMAVVCEEFPHELGDFAVLLASGMSTKQAVGYNFLSACTCYFGMIVGILVGDFTEGSTFIFAFAGGMFLYIALVDMMGELSSALDEALTRSTGDMIRVLLLQNIGILTGVFALFVLAKYSEQINFEHFQ